MSAPISEDTDTEAKTACLVVSSAIADIVKKELERMNLLDNNKRLKHLRESGKVAIPLNLSQKQDLAIHHQVPFLNSLKDVICSKIGLDKDIYFEIQHKTMPHSKQSAIQPPVTVLKRSLKKLFKGKNSHWNHRLEIEIPTQWERHGDLVLLGSSAFSSPEWQTLGEDLWVTVCKCLSCKRVAQKSCVSPNGYRSPQVKMLYGDNSWVEHVDNRIRYSYDVTKCMFSAGNITEKLRIAQFDCTQETVVDMCAGIGYFSLPYLVHARARHVHACEWNPDAVDALQRNLALNGVSERCTVHFGDNRRVCPKGVADRVNLGLLPSSEPGWPTACAALNPQTGGILHIHENVGTKGTTQHQQAKNLNTCHRTRRNNKACDGTNESEADSNATNEIKSGFANVTNQLKYRNDVTNELRCRNDVTNDINFDSDGTSQSEVLSNLTAGTTKYDSIPQYDAMDGTNIQIHSNVEKVHHEHQEPDLFHKIGNQRKTMNSECNHTTVIPTCTISDSKRKFLPWAVEVSHKIRTLLQVIHNSQWWTTIVHIERVKSYAPHIDHIVLDVDCRPIKD